MEIDNYFKMSSTVEQIKSRLNIVDVVQTYIKLQKAGANFKANCPFHQERTPSFFVSPARDSWHCFGCSRGGDIFSFVTEIEGVDFIEALKILADKAGVEIDKVDHKEKNERLKLFQLMEDAKKFYELQLRKNQAVIDYLKKRGMTGQTAKNFGVGFAPDGWRNLHDFLKSKGYDGAEMEKAGMVVKKNSGDYYDRFRSRIMFPLTDASGRIAGFTGRVFGQESPENAPAGQANGGKYVNTPQTILYDKSRLLYAFDKAKNEIRKKDSCVLVEGQMDAVMSHQAGMENTVAVSGTALTAEHLNLIKRLTQNIIMSFDRDSAGISAAGRGIGMALTEGFEVRIAVPPSGKDPADAVLENPANWITAVEKAKNIIDFMLDVHDDRKSVEGNVLPLVARLPSEMEKAQWVKKIAGKLNISEEPVWQELKKVKLEPAQRKEYPPPRPSVENRTRLKLLQDRLVGIALLKKEDMNDEYKEYLGKLSKEEADKIILEAELFYGGSEAFEGDFLKLKKDIEKEKIKLKLEDLTGKIRKLELQKESPAEEKEEKKLEEYLTDFHKLTKKLNEIK